MVERYLGEQVFRAGVNAYLAQHPYGNATAEDFWNALTRASGKPADAIMKGFVKQAGAPLLSVDVTCEGGRRRVQIAQQRFFSDPDRLKVGSPERWTIPVCFRDATGPTTCHLIAEPRQTVSLDGCPVWTFANADGRGYYRTEYAGVLAQRLKKAIVELNPRNESCS